MAAETDALEAVVEQIIQKLGRRIVLGTPLGIGKPNALLNALYRRVKADPSIRLDIITALSLNPPTGSSELEERFLAPIRERVWAGYPRLAYLDDLLAGQLPEQVRVIEFYVPSGSRLGQAQAQQDYISSNYTHVARDMIARGVNLTLQAVAVRKGPQGRRLSLAGNPDVTLQLNPLLRALDRPWMAVAQVNRGLPWMGGAAEVSEDHFDVVIDDQALDHAPFVVPHDPVSTADWAIGLHASRLVRDGGTLQVGIGSLGDALCHALRLRERDNARYQSLLDGLPALPSTPSGPSGSDQPIGGVGRFEQGLYVASELISNALFTLFEDGIVRRRVYEDEALQQEAQARDAEASWPEGGTCLQGAFFIGPQSFYQRLHALTEEQRALIDMNSVAEVNRVTTDYRLERLQRRHPRFINITMKATLLGSAVSDQLANGQVVSGVGGQYNFVAMAHQLPEGRSVLLLRATRGEGARLESNLVWEYPHATIPRHLRDLYVTEYGVADLRGRTDAECIEAMLAIADSRFQPQLLEQAKRAGKLPKAFQLAYARRNNLPQVVAAHIQPAERDGSLPAFPFGSDFTELERSLGAKLKRLQRASQSWTGRVALARAIIRPAAPTHPELRAALRHLGLDRPDTIRQRWLARLVGAGFRL